jgi:LmbE family N-acetylglucosaminyl deacetylase
MYRLLCVTAHPDDEAGAFGGTLAYYAERGVGIRVVCLTSGTAARNRGTAKSNEELACMRRAELAAACKVLGVPEFEALDYLDAHLDRTSLLPVVGDIVLRIREFQPHVVVTFGPDGGSTGHLDHGMAGIFATLAFEWAARPDRYPEQLTDGIRPHRAQKLYYFAAAYLLEGRHPIAPPTSTTRIEFGDRIFEQKIEAFRQHTTQLPLLARLRNNVGRHGPAETYHLAMTSEPRSAKFETDLFEDVVIES